MMDRFLRLALVVLVAVGFSACDEDTNVPEGETSTVNISVFIEDDGTAGLSEGDVPIAGAAVDLVSNTDATDTRSAVTGANGIATFSDVPAGTYTATHTPASAITDATLTSDLSQTVVAQFEGGTTNESFVYAYNPGTIAGQFFRDEDGDDAYDPVVDTTLAGFQVELYAGADTAGDPDDETTVDDTGSFEFDLLAHGDYTLVVTPVLGTEVTDSTIAVSVSAGQTSDVLIEFTGGQAVSTIAEARALAIGSTVTVEGVVTAGTGVYSSSNFYMQDETAGIIVFIGGGGPSIDVAMGDSLLITGTTGEFSGELQLAGGANLEIEILSTGGSVPAARTVTATDVNAGDFQGELVVAEGLTIDSLGTPFSGGNFNVYVTDATGSFVVFVDLDAGITPDMVLEGETYSITGIMTRFNDLFEIKPRASGDLVLTSTPAGEVDIGVARLLPDGEITTVRGVVTDGQGTYRDDSFYIQDETGGILVFGVDEAAGIVAGDSLEITGELDTFGERELVDVTITDHGTGTMPTPLGVTAADVNAGQFQGELVVADSVEVLSVSVSGSGNITLRVRDNAGEFTIFGDVDTGLLGTDFTEGESYEITGIMAAVQFGSDPTLYQIKPRSSADVVGL